LAEAHKLVVDEAILDVVELVNVLHNFLTLFLQTRGERTPMLTCSSCRVAKFCSADHQKMASEKAAFESVDGAAQGFLQST
jgi:hypothetical protein